jgi:hypothetical protein
MKAETPLPKLDIVGPSVDDDVRRLIRRYGPSAVRETVKQQTKCKPGMKPKNDWLDLDETLKRDAQCWLAGGDPFAERTNHSIAKEMAKSQPGQSYGATFDRIRKKLARDRPYYAIVHAAWLSEDQYPYTTHLKALRALSISGRLDVWKATLHRAERAVADFTTKFGCPSASMTMREVEATAAKALPIELADENGNVLRVLLGSPHE